MSAPTPDFDIAIVGSGPVGLAFARSLQGAGYRIVLIERQPLEQLARPEADGREIALTHASRRILESLGAWQRIDEAQVSRLKDAKIFNGPSPFALHITAATGGVQELGYFVPNHLIRAALFDAVQAQEGVSLRSGVAVAGIQTSTQTGAQAHTLELSDGSAISASLVVAADSRFSETRRMMGIGAAMKDFGRSMLVCRFVHEAAHGHVTWQWFDYAQTLALLPLNANQNGNVSNVVLTLPQHEMQAMQALDDAAFSANITRRFANRLGAMRKLGKATVYPLVAVYAHRFVASRYALIGDAAVGMHPITAHGFNFGLQSQQRLANQIWLAKRRLRDFAGDDVLQAYERSHRLATWPLYQATNAIATVYTDDSMPARALRNTALRVANAVYPFKKAIAAHLSQV